MAIAFRGAGTEAHASSGNITPSLPSGGSAPQANDIGILFALTGANPALSVSGWTAVTNGALNLGATARICAFYKRMAGGDSNPTITGATQDIQANILVFSGCTTSGEPVSAISSRTNTASTTVTADAITPADADSMIVFLGSQYDTGSATSTFSGYSGTNPTFTEGFDNNFQGSTINTSICGAYGTKNDTTTTGSRTATATSSLAGGTFLLALIPAGAGGSLVVNPLSGRGGTTAQPLAA